MKPERKLGLGVFAVLALASTVAAWQGCARTKPETQPGARNPRWAAPVNLPGCGNLHKVSETLYRCEQPTPEGFRGLQRLGIRTVVNLRAFHADDDDLKESGVEGFQTERISFKTWHAEDEDVVKFLKIVTDRSRQPAVVHCQHGADRTGTMCAVYRIVVQGWSKADALEEMKDGGFGYHAIWRNLPGYLNGLDVEKLRRAAGLPESVPASAKN